MLVITNLTEKVSLENLRTCLQNITSQVVILPVPTLPAHVLSKYKWEETSDVIIFTTPRRLDPLVLIDVIEEAMTDLEGELLTVIALDVEQHQEEGEEEFNYLKVILAR